MTLQTQKLQTRTSSFWQLFGIAQILAFIFLLLSYLYTRTETCILGYCTVLHGWPLPWVRIIPVIGFPQILITEILVDYAIWLGVGFGIAFAVLAR